MMIRAATDDDRGWMAEFARARWGGTAIALRGALIDASALPAMIAETDGRRCGLATYDRRGDEWEIVTLDAAESFRGVGTALVDAVADLAAAENARRLLVTTTNDNLDALRFYQRRGFVICAIHPNAIEESRRIKQTIPEIGSYGIPIRDEIELVRPLPSLPA